MKLSRWPIVSLLSASVLAVLCGGACWWVTWPERTVRKFVALMGDGEGAVSDGHYLVQVRGTYTVIFHPQKG
jgi:hypothetical protein